MRYFTDAATHALHVYLEKMRCLVNEKISAGDLPIGPIELDKMSGVWESTHKGNTFFCTPFYEGDDGLYIQINDNCDCFESDWEYTGDLENDANNFIRQLIRAWISTDQYPENAKDFTQA